MHTKGQPGHYRPCAHTALHSDPIPWERSRSSYCSSCRPRPQDGVLHLLHLGARARVRVRRKSRDMSRESFGGGRSSLGGALFPEEMGRSLPAEWEADATSEGALLLDRAASRVAAQT